MPMDRTAYYADASTPAVIATISAAMADAEADAIAGILATPAQPYIWANAAARTAQTGMSLGYLGIQVDTGIEWRYDGSNWKIWNAVTPISYTPTLTGFGGTTGTIVAQYTVSSGKYSVDISNTFVSGTTLASHPSATLPVAAAATYLADAMLGRVYLLVAGNNYPATTLRYTTTSLITSYPETASGTYIGVASISSTVPATWATASIWRAHADFYPA